MAIHFGLLMYENRCATASAVCILKHTCAFIEDSGTKVKALIS